MNDWNIIDRNVHSDAVRCTKHRKIHYLILTIPLSLTKMTAVYIIIVYLICIFVGDSLLTVATHSQKIRRVITPPPPLVCVWSLFCYALLSVLLSFSIILMKK